MGNGCQSSADVPVPKVADPKVPAGWFDAARKGDVAAGEALLKSSPKFDVNAPSPPDGLTALGLCCETGHAAYATFLVRTACADVRRCSHRVGDRPLHAACLNGDVAVARALLDCGARVNEPLAGTLLTPLHHAAIAGRTDVVALLLERKADCSLKCSRGETAADAAQKHGKHSVVAQITAVAGEGVLASTEVKKRVGVEDTWRSLVRSSNAAGAEALLKQHKDAGLIKVDAEDDFLKFRPSQTPLAYACQHGDAAFVALLLSHGAHPNKPGGYHPGIDDEDHPEQDLAADGKQQQQKHPPPTPLEACLLTDGNAGVVRALLLGCARVNAKEAGQRSPLHIAADQGHLEATRLLLQCRADARAVDARGRMPLELVMGQRLARASGGMSSTGAGAGAGAVRDDHADLGNSDADLDHDRDNEQDDLAIETLLAEAMGASAAAAARASAGLYAAELKAAADREPVRAVDSTGLRVGFKERGRLRARQWERSRSDGAGSGVDAGSAGAGHAPGIGAGAGAGSAFHGVGI